MTTYVYVAAATGYVVQSAPYTPLSGHTLAPHALQCTADNTGSATVVVEIEP